MLPMVLADFINGHDVRMRKARRGFSLRFEALDQILGGQRAATDKFHGDQTIQADLPSLEHDAHAAAGDLFQQFIVTEVMQLRAGNRCAGFGSLAGGLFDARLQSQAEEASTTIAAWALGGDDRPAFSALAASTHSNL